MDKVEALVERVTAELNRSAAYAERAGARPSRTMFYDDDIRALIELAQPALAPKASVPLGGLVAELSLQGRDTEADALAALIHRDRSHPSPDAALAGRLEVIAKAIDIVLSPDCETPSIGVGPRDAEDLRQAIALIRGSGM